MSEWTKEALMLLIGQPPHGSHPDEWMPRAGSWHEERQNWIKEVDKLRLALKDKTDLLNNAAKEGRL